MSFGRTSRGLTYEGMREAILALLADIAEVAEAELEPITSVATDKIPRAGGGKISGAELKKFFEAETFSELELSQVLARLRELAP